MARRGLLTLFAIAVLLRVGYAVSLYDPSLLSYYLDDFTSYSNAAKDILRGDLAFTNSLYMKRPPLYSLMVAALGIQPILIIAVNILLGSAIVPLTYVLARQTKLSQELAFLAALLVAIDPTSVRYSAVLRADALASLTLALAFISLIKLKQVEARLPTANWGFLSGGLIILSAFTRPAAYLLWIPMGFWVVFVKPRHRLLAIASIVVLPILGTSLWKQHNAVYFQNDSFSTAGTFQLLYVRAASVLYQGAQLDIDEIYANLARRVEEGLGNEVEDITENWRHRHLASSSEMQAIMTSIAIDVFREYPQYYLLTIPVGLYRMLLKVSGWPWWLGVGWNVGFLFAAGFGIWRIFRTRRFANGIFLLFPCLYFVFGTLLVATASLDTRARVMVTPLLAIMAAHGALAYLSRRRTASASPSPPACS